MYRGTDWSAFFAEVRGKMNWGWMMLSMLFGITAQLARAWRWKMTLTPIGETPSARLCDDAVFVSYAASLVVPRVGEVTRCGTLKRYGGVSFTKALGTVFTERVVDSLVMLVLTAVAFFYQIPKMLEFVKATGVSVNGWMERFTLTGYIVTAICLVAAVGAGLFMVKKYVSRGRSLLHDLKEGILSLRKVENFPLYAFLTLSISASYFLHFYIAFFSFDFTSSISPTTAFLIFCVGMFAVLVPTPNGAGPWHFAVKTMLVLYGVAEGEAILFVLVVHTLQTALVVVLGLYGWADISVGMRNKAKWLHNNTNNNSRNENQFNQ